MLSHLDKSCFSPPLLLRRFKRGFRSPGQLSNPQSPTRFRLAASLPNPEPGSKFLPRIQRSSSKAAQWLCCKGRKRSANPLQDVPGPQPRLPKERPFHPAHIGTLGLCGSYGSPRSQQECARPKRESARRNSRIAHCPYHGALLSSGVVLQANPVRDL